MKFHAICLFSAVSLVLPTSLDARTWKEATSGRTFDGDFLKVDGDQVVVRRADSTTVKVALDKLSDEDKKFVAEKAAPKADAAATDEFKWETDFEVAKKRAKDEKKEIFVDFTGSDWCHWCMSLKSEVLDEPTFQEYAKKHYVMLELDFPRQKELPAKEKEQNEKLQNEFKVNGFPTVLILNAKGREVARTGYQEGGPEKYIDHLKTLPKK